MRSNWGSGSAINMAENAETIEDPLDGQTPGDVVVAVEHHVRVLKVPMTNLRVHSTKAISIHNEEERRQGAGASL